MFPRVSGARPQALSHMLWGELAIGRRVPSHTHIMTFRGGPECPCLLRGVPCVVTLPMLWEGWHLSLQNVYFLGQGRGRDYTLCQMCHPWFWSASQCRQFRTLRLGRGRDYIFCQLCNPLFFSADNVVFLVWAGAGITYFVECVILCCFAGASVSIMW